MYPILFQIGPFTIYSFGTLMALAALSAGWIVCLELQRNRYNPELASTLIFAAAIGGLVWSFNETAITRSWPRPSSLPLQSAVCLGPGFFFYLKSGKALSALPGTLFSAVRDSHGMAVCWEGRWLSPGL